MAIITKRSLAKETGAIYGEAVGQKPSKITKGDDGQWRHQLLGYHAISYDS